MFIIIVILLGCDRPMGLHFLVPALLSILTPLSLPSSSVSLFYFILSVPMRECSYSPVPIAVLNGTSFFPAVQLHVHNVYSERKTRNSCALVSLCI